MFTYILCWFPMLIIAIANGSLRDLWYKKFVTDLQAHQISTVTLLFFLVLYMSAVISMLPPKSEIHALMAGVLWTSLTLAFEFGFGIFRGNTFKALLKDYNLLQGKLWLLVPVCLLVTPYILYRVSHFR